MEIFAKTPLQTLKSNRFEIKFWSNKTTKAILYFDKHVFTQEENKIVHKKHYIIQHKNSFFFGFFFAIAYTSIVILCIGNKKKERGLCFEVMNIWTHKFALEWHRN